MQGARLRITSFIHGLVLYTGADSKLVLNQQPAPSKMSQVESLLNRCLLMVFVFQVLLCVVSAVMSVVWEVRRFLCVLRARRWPIVCVQLDVGLHSWYLGLEETVHSAIISGIPRFFTFISLYNYMIPISLYVTVELVKVLVCSSMGAELTQRARSSLALSSSSGTTRCMTKRQTRPRTQTPPTCWRSWVRCAPGSRVSSCLRQQITHVLSDKTGTLTENVMRLDRVSIAGVRYDASNRSSPSYSV